MPRYSNSYIIFLYLFQYPGLLYHFVRFFIITCTQLHRCDCSIRVNAVLECIKLYVVIHKWCGYHFWVNSLRNSTAIGVILSCSYRYLLCIWYLYSSTSALSNVVASKFAALKKSVDAKTYHLNMVSLHEEQPDWRVKERQGRESTHSSEPQKGMYIPLVSYYIKWLQFGFSFGL